MVRSSKEFYEIAEMGKDNNNFNKTFWSILKTETMKSGPINLFKSAVNKMFRDSNKEYIRDILFNGSDKEIRWAIAADLFRGNMKNLLDGKISVDQFLNVLRWKTDGEFRKSVEKAIKAISGKTPWESKSSTMSIWNNMPFTTPNVMNPEFEMPTDMGLTFDQKSEDRETMTLMGPINKMKANGSDYPQKIQNSIILPKVNHRQNVVPEKRKTEAEIQEDEIDRLVDSLDRSAKTIWLR